MKGKSTRYSSLGSLKNAQMCRCLPSTEPAKRMGASVFAGLLFRSSCESPLALLGVMGRVLLVEIHLDHHIYRDAGKVRYTKNVGLGCADDRSKRERLK